MNFRVQFLDGSALVTVESNADAHHAAGAIELAEELDWRAAWCACAFSMRTDARSTSSWGRHQKDASLLVLVELFESVEVSRARRENFHDEPGKRRLGSVRVARAAIDSDVRT